MSTLNADFIDDGRLLSSGRIPTVDLSAYPLSSLGTSERAEALVKSEIAKLGPLSEGVFIRVPQEYRFHFEPDGVRDPESYPGKSFGRFAPFAALAAFAHPPATNIERLPSRRSFVARAATAFAVATSLVVFGTVSNPGSVMAAGCTCYVYAGYCHYNPCGDGCAKRYKVYTKDSRGYCQSYCGYYQSCERCVACG